MPTVSSFESRVPLVERDQVPPEVADLYDKLYADRGVVPNMFKALSNVPPLVLGIAAMLKPLMSEGALPGWYKELIATRVATLNQCEYCVSAHRHLAVQRGATPEQVACLDNFEIRSLHGEGESRLSLRRPAPRIGQRHRRSGVCCLEHALPFGGDRRTHRSRRGL